MAFTSYLSYTRAVKSKIKPLQAEIAAFRGSSLNRKKHEPKANEALPGQAGPEADGLPKKQMGLHLWLNQANEYETAEPGTSVPKDDKGRTFSPRSRNKCQEKIFAMFRATPSANFAFLTLGFIESPPDRVAVGILNKFLTVLRKKTGPGMLYIWVAERQGSGRIHFHLILNRRIPIVEVNSMWVLQQYNSGLKNDVLSREKLNELYYAGDYAGVQNYLNPADIKPVHTIEGLAGYLTNYITKNRDIFYCSVWHCNRAVSALFTSMAIQPEIFNETSDPRVNRITTRKGKTYVNKTFVVNSKTTGLPIAFVNTIYNKKHFAKRCESLDELNRLVIDLVQKKERRDNEIKAIGDNGLTFEQILNIAQKMNNVPMIERELLYYTPGEWLNENISIN